MNTKDGWSVHHEVETIYRQVSRRVLATLIRLLGNFELAEEALQDAFIAAVEQWPYAGIPDRPRAWLISVGRFKAIDSLRRRARFNASLTELALLLEGQMHANPADQDSLVDDRLRLIFICCHPALTADAQVALTLREVCDLSTEQIARAFLISPSTVAQRIVRAKSKIRRFGVYSVQAAIAAVHAQSRIAEDTDWQQIVGLYDVLTGLTGSAVVSLNRAVAVAMLEGPAAGLKLVDGLLEADDLQDYHLAWSAKADLNLQQQAS